MQAEKYGQSGTEKVVLELSDAELKVKEELRAVWNSILKIETADDTDFFGAGAGSMNVVQLVEEVKEKAGMWTFLLRTFQAKCGIRSTLYASIVFVYLCQNSKCFDF